MHHCIRGWTGIAKWGGLPMRSLVDLVCPETECKGRRVLLVWRFALRGSILQRAKHRNVFKPQCLLASGMNGHPLTAVYGVPLSLRVENQLGYKIVKWIGRIEFIESEKDIGLGEGGRNEDDEYFDLLPNI